MGVGGQQRRAEGEESGKLAFPLQNHRVNVQLGLHLFSLPEKNSLLRTNPSRGG